MPAMESIAKQAERITLVKAVPEHAELLCRIFSGVNAQKYNPITEISVEELARSLEQSGSAFSERALFYRLFGAVDDVLFGTFIIKNIAWRKKTGEIGFSLLDEWQGRGLGSALVYKCVLNIFRQTELDSIWATVSQANEASKKIMQRLGFADCGFYKEKFLIKAKPVAQVVYKLNRQQARELFL